MASLRRRFAMSSVVLVAFALAGTTGLCAEDTSSIDYQKVAESERRGFSDAADNPLFCMCQQTGNDTTMQASDATAAVPALNDARHDSDREIARRAADEFAESILALHPEIIGPDQPEKWQAFNEKHREIRSLGPEIIPHLCRLAGHENPRVRRWALDAIPWVEKGSENAVQTLINALSDSNPVVRFEAAEGLGRIGRSGTHDYSRLFEALHDEDPNVRTAAGQSMAALSPTPAELPKLIAALENADPVVRRLAADGLRLGRATAKSALPALEAMAGDENIDVRSAAFRAIRSIKETPIPPWRWNAEISSPLHCMTLYNGPYDLEIARKESGELVSRVRKDGRILHEWPVHAMGTPFVIDSDVLYYPRLREFAAGCVLIAFDLKQGKKLWETDLEAMGPIAHSKYYNAGINLSLNEGILRIDGSEMAGTYTEFVEAGTGKTLANYR
ncbi:MAG TPA: HEAT repeat domain-containing protein [Thermoguttaceae bacterium]|nr:HEAT repeat domain-containing protein [Thermoguttaceae bacterium]